MHSDAQAAPVSKKMLWAGWITSGLPALGLFFSAYMKFMRPAEVLEGFDKFGYDHSVIFTLAIVELACTLLYVIPQTSVLGAILLTGYLGGAVATHVRINDLFIAPIILGILLWTGLYLRDSRLRALLPLRH